MERKQPIVNFDDVRVDSAKSITIARLKQLYHTLESRMRAMRMPEPSSGYTSEHLRAFMRWKDLFPRLRYNEYFSTESPAVVITYMWLGDSLKQVIDTLSQKFRLEDRVWIDILFNDQRTDQDAMNAVRQSLHLYFVSANHVILSSFAQYPQFEPSGRSRGTTVMCYPWDRCWCILEMAVRYCGVKTRGSKPSIFLLPADEARRGDVLASIRRLESHVHDFFQRMQGRPDDVTEIQRVLISKDLFSSTVEFNTKMREMLVDFRCQAMAAGSLPSDLARVLSENGLAHDEAVAAALDCLGVARAEDLSLVSEEMV
eukprot:CAMPEP_0113671274 /NCGR_PEP_ID=MMETSP0038_2-20120614/5616_1 /TAXON_ID=2898 /ORGANISM="Cryptomonas paramecium" /LENGTH=313 /DNA_ID=CAMNT_0000587413 /DNA_START=1 /DNA_END=939 /DNA_ORIENTATION=+ /assembly_acc=CAM_ASM_000170